MAITHSKVSTKPDTGDSTLIQASDWNAEHEGSNVFFGADDPGAVGAGAFWLDDSYRLWVRDASDEAWRRPSSVTGASLDIRVEPEGVDDETRIEVLESLVALRVRTTMAGSTGMDTHFEISIGTTGLALRAMDQEFNVLGQLVLDMAGRFNFFGLLSTDPEAAGVLFTDGVPSAGVPKTLMVSGG